ncbi:chromate transporter [Aestuariivirga sp.]|jgi:chromate transporter|uniref:chromate transporter n=1 Tax=Aestuariivirga sp. TaxID=2650926 RepID=UPI00378384C3
MRNSDGPLALRQIFWEFLVIGATSFGGGVVAYERLHLTEKCRWVSEDEFNAMLAISQTLPGLNAVNLAILAGDRLRGTLGALAAACALLLPGCAFVLAAGLFYLRHADNRWAALFMAAASAAATGLLFSVVCKLGGKGFFSPRYLLIVIISLSLVSFVRVPLPLLLAIVVPVSLYLYRPSRGKGGDAR